MQFLALAIALFSAPVFAAPKQLTVIAITDFHGALESEEIVTKAGQKIRAGGADYFSAYIKRLREKYPGPLVLVDGGDLFQGTMISNGFEGAPVIRLYNYLGVDAAALGNHEFDFGPAGDKAVPRAPGDDAQGALKQRAIEARFPFLAANVRDQNGKVPAWLKASVIKTTQGLRVGIIGLADPHTPSTTNSLNLKGLNFLDPLEPVITEATRLREKEKVDAIVLAAHIGAICKDVSLASQTDLASCTTRDILDLVEKMPEGLVDVVVAGHTHRPVAKRVKKTVILQAGANSRYIGWASAGGGKAPEILGLEPVCASVVKLESESTCDPFRIEAKKGEIMPAVFLGEKITPDAKARSIFAKEAAIMKRRNGQSLGVKALDAITRSYGEESALGNLTADLLKAAKPGAEIGMANGGGLRANLPAKTLQYGDIFKLAPFDNQLAFMRISGATILKLMELGASGKQGALLWSENVRFEIADCKIKSATVNGKPIDPEARYTVATSDYLAGGGSGVASARIPPEDVEVFWDKQYILRDVMAARLRLLKKNLRAKDYFDPQNPRQKILTPCKG